MVSGCEKGQPPYQTIDEAYAEGQSWTAATSPPSEVESKQEEDRTIERDSHMISRLKIGILPH